jgi:hypothetical protein
LPLPSVARTGFSAFPSAMFLGRKEFEIWKINKTYLNFGSYIRLARYWWINALAV